MKMNIALLQKIPRSFLLASMAISVLLQLPMRGETQKKSPPPDPDEIGRRINAFVPDKQYPDDSFVLVAVQEALAGLRENNGGVGACLVEEATEKIVERGHNRQFAPYFRSDLHAEMDLLNRYEERVKARKSDNPSAPPEKQRKVEGLVLYTSMEPCPMCLSRIINSRIKKVYYAAPDLTGGMARKVHDLPEFWRELASGAVFEPARCSPELTAIAKDLFHPLGNPKPADGQ
jgi:cytosine deaminase